MWQPQAALASGYRVLRHDRRGFGLSTGRPSIASDVLDAAALLDHAGVSSAVLIGASQGARVALRLALGVAEKVGGLVLDAPPDEIGPGRGGLTDEIPLERCRALARQGDLASVRRLWAQHPFTRLVQASAEAEQLLARMIARYPGADLLEDPAPSPLGDVRALAVPTLVLNGEHDLPSRVAAGRALTRALPNARHQLLRNAGHLASLDDPPAYEQALREFIESLGRR